MPHVVCFRNFVGAVRNPKTAKPANGLPPWLPKRESFGSTCPFVMPDRGGGGGGGAGVFRRVEKVIQLNGKTPRVGQET